MHDIAESVAWKGRKQWTFLGQESTVTWSSYWRRSLNDQGVRIVTYTMLRWCLFSDKGDKDKKKGVRACFHGHTKIFIVWKWAFVRVCIVGLCLKWREVWNTARPSRCGGVPIISQGTNPLETGVHNPTEIQYLVTWTRNGCSFDWSMMPTTTSSKSSTIELRDWGNPFWINFFRARYHLHLRWTIFLMIMSLDSPLVVIYTLLERTW